MTKVDILGASGAALSMIFELIQNSFVSTNLEIRIIKNTDHCLDIEFAIPEIDYRIEDQNSINDISSHALLGVYKSQTKKLVYEDFKKKFDCASTNMINLIHKQASVANTVKLGHGIQINPMATVAPYSQLEDFVSVNRNSSIGHHTKVSKFCTINPGAHIAGHCHLEEQVTVGMGACIIEGKTIGKNSIIGAGALITRDVPENVLAMGVPAKIIKKI